jgi:RNA 3'-phosphate cyclase
MIVIDGAQGGGQILRTALSYSALSGRPVRVVNIRGARPKPGLRPQHLLAVNAAAELCGARVAGAEPGSTEIEFTPGAIAPPSQWRLDVGTAGSVMLILQALLPCLALGQVAVNLTLTGGTNNPFAPTYEYLRHVLVPTLETMGFRVEAELVSRGFYPRGGGEIQVHTQPAGRIRSITRRERGELRRVWGISYSSNLPEHIVERMARACRDQLRRAGMDCDEFALDTGRRAASPGCGIIAFAEFDGGVIAGDALGERGKPAEKVGTEAAEALLRELRSGAPVDTHLGDQMVPWVALADGESAYVAARRSDHLVSAVAVAQQVIGAQFELKGAEPVEVRCRGIGHARGCSPPP